MSSNDSSDTYEWQPPMPPVTATTDGNPRRIGVELEMIELDVEAVSDIVAGHIDGDIERTSRYEHKVLGDDAGDWIVELDFEYLKERGRQRGASEDELTVLVNEAAENVLRFGAEAFVPVEVVTPPLPFARLGDVQSLVPKLRDAGAKGSGAGLSYAFGMQFNPELPALDAATIASYLKAFFCLYDWLAEQSDVDLTRRLTGFSASFPQRYVRTVVDPAYWPDCEQFIDDYLADNPTRNRALDLLPLFLHVDERRLRAVVDDPRVKARPTLHYRLPNCEIHRPGWGIHLAWRDWLEVEALASDRDKLDEVAGAYAEWLDKPLSRLFESWSEEVGRWLD